MNSKQVDSYLANWNPNAIMGDAYRSLCNDWKFDVRQITCPIFIYQGDADYAQGAKPESAKFIKQLHPEATLEWVKGCGHVCVLGPEDDFQARIVKAVAAMPLLEAKTNGVSNGAWA